MRMSRVIKVSTMPDKQIDLENASGAASFAHAYNIYDDGVSEGFNYIQELQNVIGSSYCQYLSLNDTTIFVLGKYILYLYLLNLL